MRPDHMQTQAAQHGRANGPKPAGLQAGAALLIALIMVLLITIVGLAAARTQTLEVRMSANLQNHNVAEQGAEAALRYAESQISSGAINSANFTSTGTSGGYYTFNTSGTSVPAFMCVGSTIVSGTTYPAWTNYSSACGTTSYTPLVYGGTSTMQGILQPTYIIELLPAVAVPGTGSTGELAPPPIYRITANGYGLDGTSSVRLQSIYR